MNFAGALRIKEEKELPDARDHIEGVEWLCQLLKLWEGGHELKDVVLKVFLFEVAIATRVVQWNLDARLEQINLTHDVVEERYDLDSAELITLKLQEGRRGEELAAFWGQALRDEDELVVVDALCSVVGLR